MTRILAFPVAVALAIACYGHLLSAQDTKYAPLGQQIPHPPCLELHWVREGPYVSCTQTMHQDWLKDLQHWRTERLVRIGFDDARYKMPQLLWTRTSFIQAQAMVEDRFLYNPAAGKYTVARYLDDLEERFGGIDAVLIWPSYPNMGIDDRNQLDMIRAMPEGIEGVRQMVEDFHRRGVRVLFPITLWDDGTRDPGKQWPQAIVDMMKDLNVDGMNGDTQDGVPLSFSIAADGMGHPLAFEPEHGPADEALAWNVMTWGQYKFSFVPDVDRYKWLEPRHMVNISDRWSRNKIDDLQFAFFNGVGWESWENLWGIWNGITPRDAEATRRMAAIERGAASFLTSPDWEPFYPMRRYGVFASRWPLPSETVWTIVNRNEYDVQGPQMSIPAVPGMHYYDLYHGVELVSEKDGSNNILSFSIESRGFGAVLATVGEPAPRLRDLMGRMKDMTSKPASLYSHEWRPLPQQIVPIPQTERAAGAPQGMIAIPGGEYIFTVHGIEIEGSDDAGVDVQYPWEKNARRFHEHRMKIEPFFVDKYPVTNDEYKKFVDATGYHPTDERNYLRDWQRGTYPEGWGNKPVTWVSLEDARAYAEWAGKRLPHEWEWQYVAQGGDHERIYPWGGIWEPKNIPVPVTTRYLTAPDDVNGHPSVASPFGVMDMVGNVWQWTDEFADEHTRAAILRGGSYYQPRGSIWYFPQAYRNDEHGKLLLMAPSYDRAGTIGFRCVKDAR